VAATLCLLIPQSKQFLLLSEIAFAPFFPLIRREPRAKSAAFPRARVILLCLTILWEKVAHLKGRCYPSIFTFAFDHQQGILPRYFQNFPTFPRRVQIEWFWPNYEASSSFFAPY